MARKRIAQRTERVSRNPVTGEIETVVLDAVHRSLELIANVVENQMLKLDSTAQRYTLAERVIELATGMLPHTDSPNTGEESGK